MKKLNLESLSIDELWRLHEELNQYLSTRLNAEKRALEKRLAQLRRENEVNVVQSDQKPVPRKKRAYPKVHPKYRNPNEPHETWSGRGKQPKWLAAQLKTGRSMEEFLIRHR
ncbi:H-NS histone family protein [Bradyrhizobium sp.]|uniref:H-NS histone family protein n=1 Tax=Bradyrhizobium sp. TaxID=376 RepID=UPI002392244F|nr:H-NS histone family protein [Bradyrhizobium sp.]MDE2379866.1 H-NS histone family protein [Bradyrhizobium sp.]